MSDKSFFISNIFEIFFLPKHPTQKNGLINGDTISSSDIFFKSKNRLGLQIKIQQCCQLYYKSHLATLIPKNVNFKILIKSILLP